MAKKSNFVIEFEFRLVLVGVWLIRILPFTLTSWFTRRISCMVFLFDRRHRERVLQHLLHVGLCTDEHEARRIAVKSFCHVGQVFVEMFTLDREVTEENIRKHVTFSGSQAAIDMFFNPEKPSPTILVTGHYGNWELIPAAYSLLSGRHLLSIMRPFDNPKLCRYFTQYRSKANFDIVHKKGALRPLLAALRNGDSVGMIADQHAGAKDGGIECEFFGHPAMTHSSPARLHLRTGIPILVTLLRRRKDAMRFEFVCSDPIMFAKEEQSGDREADVQRVAQLYTSALEELIREDPGQWNWAHRRWMDINR